MPTRPCNGIKAPALASFASENHADTEMADSTDRLESWNEFDPASRLNWDFDSVPDDEIIACCIWEYARESNTIAIAADLHLAHTPQYWYRPHSDRASGL